MIFLILLTAIILPLLAKNKSLALIGSMCILFIPWGLQFEAANDWPGNLERWQIITNYLSKDIVDNSGRELEGIYVYFVKLFQDFGFFGWLILSAIFELCIIYFLIKKFVPKQYYWLAIFILMMRIDYGFLFINSNRQSLAVFTTIIASIVLCKEDFKHFFLNNTYIRLMLATILIFVAKDIHTSAVVALPLVLVYILAINMKDIKLWLFIAVNVLFIARFFFDISTLQGTVLMYMDMYGIQDAYDSYIDLMDSKYMNLSIIEQTIYFMIMNATMIMYNKFNSSIKYFALCTIVSIILGGFIYGNLGRICQYYYIYMIVLIPAIITTLPISGLKTIKKIRRQLYTFLILYIIYSFIRDINMSFYEGWINFKTILSVSEWI